MPLFVTSCLPVIHSQLLAKLPTNRLIVTYFDRHMEFVLDSFSVKADDSSYFTKDGYGGKEFDCAVPLSFRERSCSSRAQRFPAVLLRRPTLIMTRIDGFARLRLQLSGKESHRRCVPVE